MNQSIQTIDYTLIIIKIGQTTGVHNTINIFMHQ